MQSGRYVEKSRRPDAATLDAGRDLPCGVMRPATLVLMALAANAVMAPAIDFALPLPAPCSMEDYTAAVQQMSDMRIFKGQYERRERKRPDDHPGGSKLVKPVQERRVPIAEGMALHYEYARTRLRDPKFFPLDARLRRQALPPDARKVIEWQARYQPEDLVAERTRRLEAIHTIASGLEQCSAAINRRGQPKHVSLIAADVNTAFLCAVVDAIDWPARQVPHMFVTGFYIWDPVDGRIYRELTPTHTPDEAAELQRSLLDDTPELMARVEQRVQQTATRHGPRAAREQRGVEQCTAKEIDAGLIAGPFTPRQIMDRCPDGLVPMPRFAKDEGKDTPRCIDDGQWAQTNDATRSLETIVNPSYIFPILVGREMEANRLRGQRGATSGRYEARRAVGISFRDLKSAFKRIPTAQPCLTVFAIWDPKAGGGDGGAVRYYIHHGHPFGLTAAVINFAQYPALISAMVRTLYGVGGTDAYVDDFMQTDYMDAGNTSGAALEHAIASTGGPRRSGGRPPRGPHLDPKKTKPLDMVNNGLGVDADARQFASTGQIIFMPTALRRQTVMEHWDNASAAQQMLSHEAAQLHGRSNYLLDTAIARVGRAAMLPVVDRATHHGPTAFTPAMAKAREFFGALLRGATPRLPPLRIGSVPDARRPILLYTDASFQWKRKRKMECGEQRGRGYVPRDHPLPEPWQFDGRLGAMIHDPEDGFTEDAEGAPADELTLYFLRRERKTYIAQLEALAVLAAMQTWAERIAGRRVVLFIDNTVALSAVVHGYARVDDLAAITNAIHLTAAGLRTSMYADWVPSKANIADLPSRGSHYLPKALGAQQVPLRVPTRYELERPAEDWFDEAHETGHDLPWPV